jgi:hypothetical protein
MTLVVSIVTAALVVMVVLSPFFVGRGGALQAGSSVDSANDLLKIKSALLERYLADEKDFLEGRMNRLVWQQRRQFLVNRYVDTVRRLDYVQHLASMTQESSEEDASSQQLHANPAEKEV